GRLQIRAHGEIAARDVVADARRRHVRSIADDTADRHRVAKVAVGAQDRRRVWFRGRAALELGDGFSVVHSEHFHQSIVPLAGQAGKAARAGWAGREPIVSHNRLMGDMASPSLFPGTLDMLILKTLTRGSMHGYSIAEFIQQASRDALRVEEG